MTSSIEIKKMLSGKVTDRINSNILRGLNDSKIVEDTLKLFKDRTEYEARQERSRTDQQSYLHMLSITKQTKTQVEAQMPEKYDYLPKTRTEAIELIK